MYGISYTPIPCSISRRFSASLPPSLSPSLTVTLPFLFAPIPCGDDPQFLRLDSTRQALNVREDSAPWESCNMKVNSDFSGDWMKEFDGLVGPMLEDGLSVLIYGG